VTKLPDRPSPTSGLPERRLSNREFELVIRRAAELQAKEADRDAIDGISEAEAVRIGRELGLSPANLHRALAETSATTTPESGMLIHVYGPRSVRAGRAIPGEPEGVAQILERYLIEREYLAVIRRFPDRVVFTRASGMAAAVGRATSQLFARSPLLRVTNLEMTVRPLDEGHAFVSLESSLAGQRTAAAVGSLVGGGTGTAAAGAVLAIAVAPPAALVALPILGASVFGGRAYYEGVVRNVQVQLESLLDRLEHGELPPPARAWSTSRR
jgi:hypothetical protein